MPINKTDSYSINYEPLPHGASGTEISFFSGTPDLVSLFESKTENRRLFVTDTNIASLDCMEQFVKQFGIQDTRVSGTGKCGNNVLIIINYGEENKTIETVLSIVKAALDAAFTRKDIFTGIGGGVVCDMTAFAASIYKRGARAEFVPTTLLAMVDAAVGGKTGCDFDDYKNMIGSFFPVENLYVFPAFVNYQSHDQFRSGFGEAVKTALLFNRQLFEDISRNRDKISARDPEFIYKMIRLCVEAKAKIVEEDLMEKNRRMLLNLGHTFGHALETCAGLGKINHGDAVVWGMARALELSRNLGLCSESYVAEVFSLFSFFGWETGPESKVFKGPGKLLEAMRRDKKNSSNEIRVILQKGLEDSVITEVTDAEILKVLE